MNAVPPIAPAHPYHLTKHDHVRNDPYYWLKEREKPEVIAYLEAENAYTQAVMAHTKPLQEILFEEMKGRIKKDDSSVPYRLDDYYYYTRVEGEKEYPIYCRKYQQAKVKEQVILDVNELAQGHNYCQVSGLKVSTNHSLLAYGIDTVGRRIYTLHIKDLKTGKRLPDVITNVTGNHVWANDNRTLFYTRMDPETLRSYRVFRHVLGTDPNEDVLIYEEADETYNTYIDKSKSRKYLIIHSSSTLSDECRILDADTPNGKFRMFLPRENEHEYSIDHIGDRFYILSNDQAKNFRLMETAESQTAKSAWQEVVAHREDVLLEGFELFQDYLILDERSEGLNRLRVKSWQGDEDYYIGFQDPAYTCYVGFNPEADTPLLRYGYQSLTTPDSTFEYNMATRKQKLLKQQEVLGGFDSRNYRSERFFTSARDGVQVPVSLVYHKDTLRDGSAPLLLYAYGSYGISMDAYFGASRLSLLDRGFIYAIAHVRGGSEMGRRWYEAGKMLNKKNTFFDFIDCAEDLLARGYTKQDRLFAMGGSAGGLLMGAVINLRPDLFKGVVASVPFVDVVTTMLDESIPLTTGEYDEWGNPNDRKYYDYILSYSPYDNVEAKAYPHLLVMTGIHDSQVQYWEPAKWVARLRTLKTDNNRLLLETNLDAGHGVPPGAFALIRKSRWNMRSCWI